MKEVPYNPYSRAHGDQEYWRQCPNCGAELGYYRESGHQHWRWSGRDLESIVEVNGTVFLKCRCGQYLPTRLKPMPAYMPRKLAVEFGLLKK